MRRPSSLRIGDVLQIRVARAQPPGRGDGLVEGGVQAAGRGIHRRRQRVDVGRLQLRERAVLEDLRRQRMLLRRGASARRRRSRSRSCRAARRVVDRPRRSNSTSRSCGGELMLNSPPASVVDLAHQRVDAAGELAAQRAAAARRRPACRAAPCARARRPAASRPRRRAAACACALEARAQLAGERVQHADAGRRALDRCRDTPPAARRAARVASVFEAVAGGRIGQRRRDHDVEARARRARCRRRRAQRVALQIVSDDRERRIAPSAAAATACSVGSVEIEPHRRRRRRC